MKTILTIMLCAFGMNSNAAVSPKQSEINAMLDAWAQKWNIPAEIKVQAFIKEVGANPIINTMSEAIEFDNKYDRYVAQWLKHNEESKGALRAAYNQTSKTVSNTVKAKQKSIDREIKKWAKRWNIKSNATEEFAKMTHTNPTVSTQEDVIKYNIDYLRYLVEFWTLNDIEKFKTEFGKDAERKFLENYQIKVDIEIKKWFKTNYNNQIGLDAKSLFKELFQTSTDIKTIDQAITFELNVITIPQYYRLGIDKINP